MGCNDLGVLFTKCDCGLFIIVPHNHMICDCVNIMLLNNLCVSMITSMLGNIASTCLSVYHVIKIYLRMSMYINPVRLNSYLYFSLFSQRLFWSFLQMET